VIVGEDEGSLPPIASREIAEAVPRVRLVRVPGAGHLSALEPPAAVARAVLDVLATLPAALVRRTGSARSVPPTALGWGAHAGAGPWAEGSVMSERIVRWGLVGCGDIAEKRVASALRESRGSTLAAVARARPELAADFAARHGARRSYPDWRELIADPEIDAVYVATPVRHHAEQTVAAAAAGKHVLCEKPMALGVAECERMIAAARSHGVRLGVAYYRHHYPVVQRLRDLLASGEIGRPVLAEVQAFEAFDVPPDHPRAWFLRKAEAGGGPMFDFGCHRIEVLLDLMGPPDEIRGFLANVRFTGRDVEDTAIAHLRFRSGARGVLTVTHAAFEPRDTLDVYGSEGSAHAAVLNDGALRIVTAAGARDETHPPHANRHQPLVEDFVSAVLQGREPAVTGAIGLEVNRVLAAIDEQSPEPDEGG
jgi:predicted dehydrogenase